MRATSRIGLGLAAAAIFVFFLAPIAWIVLASVQPETAITQDPPQLTLHLDLSHYREVIRIADFWHSAWVSVQLSVITTIGTIVVGALTAYPLARLRVPGRSAVLAVLIFSTMMPAIVLAIPVLLMANKTGLRDTVIVLVLVNVAFQLPIVIWLLTNFFEAVPRSLEHAARMDGCTRLGTLFRVTIPAAAPGIAATAILILIGTWNEFLFALVLGDKHAVAITRWVDIVQTGIGTVQPPYTQIATGGVLAVLPCVLLVLVFHRRIVEGLTEGYVKG